MGRKAVLDLFLDLEFREIMHMHHCLVLIFLDKGHCYVDGLSTRGGACRGCDSQPTVIMGTNEGTFSPIW